MKYRKFGTTDLLVSEISFGAWAIGGGSMIGNTAIGWGDADDTTSINAIYKAIDAGINFFDTADIMVSGILKTCLVKQLATIKRSSLLLRLVMFQGTINSQLIILKSMFIKLVNLL